MASSKSADKKLTGLETLIMDALWDESPAAVKQVQERLKTIKPMAYSTVLTFMRILEQKGYARHRKQGRAFLYSPVVDRHSVQRSAVQYVLSRFFDGSPESLVLNILENEQLDPEELKRLKEMIKESE